MSEGLDVGTGAIGGAAQGAAIGSVIPGVGTAVGAVVGGVLGAVGGVFSSKAKKRRRKAGRIAQREALRTAAVQRRDIVRQSRMAMAQALAAGTAGTGTKGQSSSAAIGAQGSLASQTDFNLDFFDTQANAQMAINRLIGKAEQYEGNVQAIGSLFGAVGSAADAGLFNLGKPTTTTTPSPTSGVGTVTGVPKGGY